MTTITKTDNTPIMSERGLLWRLSVAVAAIPILVYVGAFLRYSVNMPAGDDYDAVLDWLGKFIDSRTVFDKFHLMLEQHNEHRIVFDRLVFLTNYVISGKINFIYLDAIGAVGLFFIFFLLVRIANKLRVSNVSILVLAFLAFNLRQWGLISFAMASIQQYWQLLFALLSLYLLRTCEDRSRFSASVIFALASTFTGAGGLLIFPIGVLYLIACRKDSRAMAIWLVFGAAAFLVYFVLLPYQGSAISKQSHELLFANPSKAVCFTLAFLGGYMRRTGPATVFGGLSLIIFVFILCLKIRNRSFNDSAFVASLISYIVLVAIAAGVSRSAIGLEEALSSRYTIYGLVLLALLYIYALSCAHARFCKRAIVLLGCAASVILYVCYFLSSIGFLRFENTLQEKYIVYPYNGRAIEILGEAMKSGYFFPVAIVFVNLPEQAKNGISYKYPVPYSVGPIMPAPIMLKDKILSSCGFYNSWVWLSKLYFDNNDLKLTFPLNTTSSYRDLLDWAAAYSDATSPYKQNYRTLSVMVDSKTLHLSNINFEDSAREMRGCIASK